MNILFTTSAAPVKSPFFTNEKRPPLGVGSLISLLRNEKHNVKFIDNYLEPSNFLEEGYLQRYKIDIIAIHANTICYRDTLRMFIAIEDFRKKGLWEGKIIVGGPHTSVAIDTIPEFVDHIVQGEGEQALLEIIQGDINEKVIRKERIKDLDKLPFQPWDIFSKYPYDFGCPWLDITPVFTMNTSRGCPFNCTFCSVGSIWGKQYSCFSPERIIEEIKYLIKFHGAKGIYFREDNFTLNSRRIEDFCDKLMSRDINILWACETRVNNLSREMIQLMSAAGCKAVYLGVESGSQEILDKLEKGITVKQIEDTINWCKKYGIRTYCSLIVGTPEDTYEDYLLTKEMVKRLKPYVYGFNVFVGIPNSPLYQFILKHNIYEYKDDLGLLYLPGYDIKAKYYYGMDSKQLVDYKFKKRTSFDKKLAGEIRKRQYGKWSSNIYSI